MITPPETMFIIIGILFISLGFTTWVVYSLMKQIKYLQDFVKQNNEVEINE